MAAQIRAIYTTDIWNANLTILGSGSFSRKEEDALDIPTIGKEDESLIQAEEGKAVHIKFQRMIKLLLYVFKETTVDRHIETLVETKIVSLLEIVNHEVAKDQKTTVYQNVETVVRQVVARGAVNVVVPMKVNNLPGSPYLYDTSR